MKGKIGRVSECVVRSRVRGKRAFDDLTPRRACCVHVCGDVYREASRSRCSLALKLVVLHTHFQTGESLQTLSQIPELRDTLTT